MERIRSALETVAWGDLLVPLAAAVGAFACAALVLAVVGRLSAVTESSLGRAFVRNLRRPLLLLAPVLALRLGLPLTASPGEVFDVLGHAVDMLVILGGGWLLIALTAVFGEYLDERFVLDIPDNLTARSVHTRFLVLRRTLVIAISVITGGALLMTFPAVRHLGAGLLASAGIAGLVLGVAARPTVETLIAGLQLALTEPIRLDDVVIVEGEWGRIEEIAATYVVVRIWDDRRLVVPVSYFLTQPFQNWTRVTADLLGQVTLELDYRTPVEELRAEAGRAVEASQLWDGRFWNLQVVDAGERTMRVRVLMSAGDASNAWDLRCEVREQLIRFLQERHPEALPRLRASVAGEVPPPAAAT